MKPCRFLTLLPLLLLLAVLGAAGVHPAAAASPYTITDLGHTWLPGAAINGTGQVVANLDIGSGSHVYLYSNGVLTDLTTQAGFSGLPRGINDAGQVVGEASTSAGTHAVLYSNGVLTDLGTMGAAWSRAYGINSTGQVVGETLSITDDTHRAFLYTNGTMTDIGSLGGATYNQALAINDSGEVVGGADTGSAIHAFLYRDGAMTDLGTLPGGGFSEAQGLNAIGQVVGRSSISSGSQHAFLYDGSRTPAMTDLGTLGGSSSGAYGINGSGQVVGYADTASAAHAFLYSGDVLTDLNTLLPTGSGWTLTQASGINDRGQIVGSGTINGATHVFLLTPPNTSPSVTSVTVPGAAQAVRTAVHVSAGFGDPDAGDTHTAIWTWGDGTTASGTVTEPSSTALGTITGSHTYTAAGIYHITVTVTDSHGAGATGAAASDTVIYNPSSSVSGKGWITSPVNTALPAMTSSGKATFSLSAKYQKGAATPSGQTQFQFQAGHLTFQSGSYQWLVVSGPQAQIKGTGSLNGASGYTFLLTARDAALAGGGPLDTLRMQITDAHGATVYDNGGQTPIGGGDIAIQTAV